MFIKKLYHHSKPLFFIIVSFLLVFAFLNIKWGAVATPAYQYGMFSGIMHRSDTQRLYQVFVNDQPFDISPWSFAERDILLVSLKKYKSEKEANSAVFNTMKRLLAPVGIGKSMREDVYTNRITSSVYTNWLKYLLQKMSGNKVTKVTVYSCLYKWSAGNIQPISSPEKETFVVAD